MPNLQDYEATKFDESTEPTSNAGLQIARQQRRPEFLTLFSTLPGEIRNMIYHEIARPPYGWIDIMHPNYSHTARTLARLHPAMGREFHGAFCRELQATNFMWCPTSFRSEATSGRVNLTVWDKWVESFTEDEAAHIRSILFRTPPFELKVRISDSTRMEEQRQRITYTLRKRYCKVDRWEQRLPFDGFQEQLDWVADCCETAKEQLRALARAVVEQVYLCDPDLAPQVNRFGRR